MKTPLSQILKAANIGFTYPIIIKDSSKRETYFEASNGYWRKHEYDVNRIYSENSDGDWSYHEVDEDGNETYGEKGSK